MRHTEALVQTVVGQALGQFVLWIYGISVREGLAIGATMFVVSYVRVYAIRAFFRRVK